jgi:hypothetical protein
MQMTKDAPNLGCALVPDTRNVAQMRPLVPNDGKLSVRLRLPLPAGRPTICEPEEQEHRAATRFHDTQTTFPDCSAGFHQDVGYGNPEKEIFAIGGLLYRTIDSDQRRVTRRP